MLMMFTQLQLKIQTKFKIQSDFMMWLFYLDKQFCVLVCMAAYQEIAHLTNP